MYASRFKSPKKRAVPDTPLELKSEMILHSFLKQESGALNTGAAQLRENTGGMKQGVHACPLVFQAQVSAWPFWARFVTMTVFANKTRTTISVENRVTTHDLLHDEYLCARFNILEVSVEPVSEQSFYLVPGRKYSCVRKGSFRASTDANHLHKEHFHPKHPPDPTPKKRSPF